MAEVLFLGMSQSAPYFSHTCNYSYRGKRVQDNLCKTRPKMAKKGVLTVYNFWTPNVHLSAGHITACCP